MRTEATRHAAAVHHAGASRYTEKVSDRTGSDRTGSVFRLIGQTDGKSDALSRVGVRGAFVCLSLAQRRARGCEGATPALATSGMRLSAKTDMGHFVANKRVRFCIDRDGRMLFGSVDLRHIHANPWRIECRPLNLCPSCEPKLHIRRSS